MTEQRRLLNIKQLKEIIPKSDATIWRWEKAGLFPRRIKIGKNSTVWDASAIEKWIADKIKDTEIPFND